MQTPLKPQLDAVLSALGSIRAPGVAGEYELHRLVAKALRAAGLPALHEVRLAPRCRIDFLVGGIGIEVKQGEQPKGRLLEQAQRYLALPELGALILVTTRGVNLPGVVSGKRVVVFGLNRLWGVSLP